MPGEIISIFENTINKFRDAVAVFDEAALNQVPFENSWTAAQVADHVLRSQSRFPQLLRGNTGEANRKADEKKEVIEKIFLDFSTKLKSPEFILPSTEPLSKTALMDRIDNQAADMKAAIEESDLVKLCLDFSLPNMGQLSGVEWSWFQIYHTQRHTKQLENIYEKIK